MAAPLRASGAGGWSGTPLVPVCPTLASQTAPWPNGSVPEARAENQADRLMLRGLPYHGADAVVGNVVL